MGALRRITFAAVTFALLLPLLTSAGFAADRCTLDRADGTVIEPQPFIANAYGARWNAPLNRIAIMAPDAASGYYRIFTVKPDGSDKHALPPVSPGHQGAVYWHPSGKYLLFTAQKAEWHGRKLFGSPDYEALPGFGRHDDIWLARADGSAFWQLTQEDNTKDAGALIPVFSPDGQHIAWSARQPGGSYKIQLADFVETPQPHLGNIRSFTPGKGSYYEPGSFTSDSQSLVYTSDQDTHSFWHSQIYRLDFASGASQRLTTGGDYNEHPTVVKTPSGDRVVYMSTKGVKRRGFSFFLGTDWYAMQLDGSGAKRLTAMNLPGKNNPEDQGKLAVACTIAMSPTGDYFLGDVQDDLAKQTGAIRTVHLTCNAP